MARASLPGTPTGPTFPHNFPTKRAVLVRPSFPRGTRDEDLLVVAFLVLASISAAIPLYALTMAVRVTACDCERGTGNGIRLANPTR